MTDTDVCKAAEPFLNTLGRRPCREQYDLEGSDLEGLDGNLGPAGALGKLDAAAYHASNVARIVQGIHEKAAGSASKIEQGNPTKIGTMRVGRRFAVREVAYEVDAFLAAARACIDFGGNVLALHLGMNGRTGIIPVLDAVKNVQTHPFAFLTPREPWIMRLRKHRDECVHYRTLRAQSGFEAVRKKGPLAHAIMPIVVPARR